MNWLTGFILFTAGVGTGILIHYWGWNKTAQIKKLMRDNNRLNKEHRELQTSVDDYFSKTDRLLTDLHSSYDAVQEHFNTGINTLGKRARMQNQLDNEPQPTLSQIGSPNEATADQSKTDEKTPSLDSVTPPKDYAPKNDAERGTLSEDFGLKST